jgi:hypothetical protein
MFLLREMVNEPWVLVWVREGAVDAYISKPPHDDLAIGSIW